MVTSTDLAPASTGKIALIGLIRDDRISLVFLILPRIQSQHDTMIPHVNMWQLGELRWIKDPTTSAAPPCIVERGQVHVAHRHKPIQIHHLGWCLQNVPVTSCAYVWGSCNLSHGLMRIPQPSLASTVEGAMHEAWQNLAMDSVSRGGLRYSKYKFLSIMPNWMCTTCLTISTTISTMKNTTYLSAEA